MQVVRDDLWLCEDCTLWAVNGDLSGIDYAFNGEEADKRAKEVTDGVASLGPHLVSADGEREFSSCRCDACGTHLAGSRHEFAVLGEEASDAR